MTERHPKATPAMILLDESVRRRMEKLKPPYEAEAIICMKTSEVTGWFDDDELSLCSGCGDEVRYRPYMPALPKLCLDCAGMRGGPFG